MKDKKQAKQVCAKKHASLGRVIRLICLHTVVTLLLVALLAFCGVVMVCNMIFNGPSTTARDVLTMSMLESSGMKWCPAVFIGEDTVAQIQQNVSTKLPEEISTAANIVIQTDNALTDAEAEWAAYPDGIRIERLRGESYTAHVMIVRDPSRVYLTTSNPTFSLGTESKRIDEVIQREKAAAAINGGAFNDDGTGGDYVGRLPVGITVSRGEIVWDDDRYCDGFAGFNEDNALVVATKIDAEQVETLNIRDGCCFGPVLIMNGLVNEEAYNANSGYNPRTCIGQRADGAVILLCIDGRQANSLGGTYADAIDIMVEYGAVNACNLDGGSSAVMYYRDMQGRYGESGALQMINNYSLLQEQAREMPTFFMVAGMNEE